MIKKNTETSVGSQMDSMEEVVGLLHGELKGEGQLQGIFAIDFEKSTRDV